MNETHRATGTLVSLSISRRKREREEGRSGPCSQGWKAPNAESLPDRSSRFPPLYSLFPFRFYNRPMFFRSDPRRRTALLLGLGVLLIFALLGALQAFNTSNVRFLNPESAGETLIFIVDLVELR